MSEDKKDAKNDATATKKNEFYTPPPRKTVPDAEGNLYGHDLYPERRGQKELSIKNTLLMKEGKEDIKKFHCEKRVYQCIKKNPLVQLMMSALKSAGCPIDLRRHLSCEVCDHSVTGGYDPEMNQIVICSNNATNQGLINSVLAHEMIHMFDYCRNDLDFKNIDHLACTEIRAANFTYCSFISAMLEGDAAFWDLKKRHQDCVKRRAVISVLAARSVSKEEATAAVERVFTKCYNDLEPIGRRIKRNSGDMERALQEASFYGYV